MFHWSVTELNVAIWVDLSLHIVYWFIDFLVSILRPSCHILPANDQPLSYCSLPSIQLQSCRVARIYCVQNVYWLKWWIYRSPSHIAIFLCSWYHWPDEWLVLNPFAGVLLLFARSQLWVFWPHPNFSWSVSRVLLKTTTFLCGSRDAVSATCFHRNFWVRLAPTF